MLLRQLELLEAALRIGSLRSAAKDLGVSQPTMSEQIRHLEEDLGVVLLIRSSRGVAPTGAATELLPQVRALLAAEQSLRQSADSLAGARTGTLRAGIVSVAMEAGLPRALSLFRERHRGVELELSELGSESIKQLVTRGALDLGIVLRLAGESTEPEFREVDVATGRLSVYASAEHRLADRRSIGVVDLAGESMIVHHEGFLLRRVFERLRTQVELDVAYTHDNHATTQRMVRAGVGLALASGIDTTSAQRAGMVVVPIEEPWAETVLTVVLRAGEQPSHATAALVALLREHLTLPPVAATTRP